jgi:hypothetical protein
MFKLPSRKILFLVVIILLALGAYWFNLPKQIPNNIQKKLFEGITYVRNVRQTPRPIIIHIVSIDLTHPKIRFLVTPGKVVKEGEIGARTTSQFLTEFNLQIAVNGSFFYPFREKFWNAYPRYSGDPVYVVGFASSRGQVYSQPAQNFETFYISADNQAQFQKPIGAIYNAISGGQLFLKQGQVQTPFIGPFDEKPYPRTALALDQAAKTLMIIVIDGKQKNYSEGVTLAELAKIVISYGADSALNMDGGGSSTLVMADSARQPILLNSPIHARIQGYERLIANHLGVYRAP